MENSDLTKQFIVDQDCEVRFRLRRGSKVSKNAVMLINKPKVNKASGEVTFTVTQPLLPTDVDLDAVEMIVANYGDSPIESKYLERVEAHNKESSINLEFRVHFPQAGSFFIQIEYFDEEVKGVNYTQPVNINVEPVIVLRDQRMKCKQLSIITVLARSLGPITRWDQIASNISQLGYNAIHYTPIQQYGDSYSHYSLADQTVIDDYYFSNEASKLSKDQRLKQLKQTVDHFREEYGLLGVIDIVLNHTASNSAWLLDHPESAYNTDDCPHLYPAWLFDKALSDFSDDFAERKNVPECPHAPYINNESDIRSVLNAIQNKVINRLNLHEFFQFNIDRVVNEVGQHLRNNLDQKVLEDFKIKFTKRFWFQKDHYLVLNEKLIKNLGYGPERHQVTLDIPVTAAYYYLVNNHNIDKALQELRGLLQKHNQEWQGKVQGFMKEALQCIEGTLRYFKLELKDHKITKDNQILRRYFTELPNQKQSKVAHNGWIMNADPMEDFALKGWHYLRRTINIWSDSVKLRYGTCPADSPFLWEHMSQYVSDMAQVFDGFRLDNAHSTPIHVCYYLLQVARTYNPNLYVMAELFTSCAEADAIFVQKLNINGLVREIQNTHDTKNLGDYFHQMTCREAVLGLIDQDFEDTNQVKYRILKPVKPNDIIYDCTHDNPAPVQKFKTGRIALSHLGVVSMADTAIATTWGYDQLLPRNLNVVTEKKLYAHAGEQKELFDIDNEDPHKRRNQKGSQAKQEDGKEVIGSPEWTPEEHKKQTDFEYEFVLYNDYAHKVYVAGEFSNWKLNNELRKESHNKWVLKLTLPILDSQDKYEFKFVLNGKDWVINPNLPQVKDKYGNINNALYFPGKTQPTQRQENITLRTNNQEYVFNDIRYARRKLNEVHEECTQNNAEIFLHQQSQDVLVIVRQFLLDHANDYDAYVSITRHPYWQEGGEYNYQTRVELPGYVTEIVFAGYLEIPNNAFSQFEGDHQYVKGANAHFKVFKDLSRFCKIERQQEKEILNFHMMPPSFTCIVKTKYPEFMKDAVKNLTRLNKMSTEELSQRLFRNTPLSGFNHILFRCDQEERDISNGQRGPYGLQNYGQFVYSGITSYMHILRQLKVTGDMGHELFNNIRDGNWFIDYTVDRLGFMKDELSETIGYLREFFGSVKSLNNSMKPKYASRVIEKLYNAVIYEVLKRRMTDQFISSSEDLFLQRLAIAAVQMWGRIPSAQYAHFKDSMAAGVPHFTTGYTRCWGRDTFISLRGLLISPGLEEEAKQTILYFAKTMRHGMIPNLHDRCNNTRFNARDATWFFIQGIKDFVSLSKNIGNEILNEQVELHFRDNDQRIHWEKLNRGEPPRKLSIAQLIHEILQVYMNHVKAVLQSHAQGIKFREWNAGQQIDSCMKDEGFNISINLDNETGFVFGGNQHNCGTWMDKMGSSDKTGNKGVPATPRDGAPIELVALLYTALRFMQEMNEKGLVQGNSVKLSNGNTWTYKEWADRIKANFEKYFWVPHDQSEDVNFVINKGLVKRRGIYKDVFRPTHQHTEYQLRPNLCIAMAYAPDLFNLQHAKICLDNVAKVLVETNCMGMKTLDPQDPSYRGDYINSDDSHGWNYHQGPEWVWPLGFFLKAKIIFGEYTSATKSQAIEEVMRFLVPHQKHIMTDVWEGLPELTNSHGKVCHDSCTSQAWSIATILDAIRDLHYL